MERLALAFRGSSAVVWVLRRDHLRLWVTWVAESKGEEGRGSMGLRRGRWLASGTGGTWSHPVRWCCGSKSSTRLLIDMRRREGLLQLLVCVRLE